MENTNKCSKKHKKVIGFTISRHAQIRMQQRGLTKNVVEKALQYGRLVYVKGAQIFAIGTKEIKHYSKLGVDLKFLDGIHVVTSKEQVVVTCYRSRNLKSLRPSRFKTKGQLRKPKEFNRKKRSQCPSINTRQMSCL